VTVDPGVGSQALVFKDCQLYRNKRDQLCTFGFDSLLHV
jgi:hypothetical protein